MQKNKADILKCFIVKYQLRPLDYVNIVEIKKGNFHAIVKYENEPEYNGSVNPTFFTTISMWMAHNVKLRIVTPGYYKELSTTSAYVSFSKCNDWRILGAKVGDEILTTIPDNFLVICQS
jgi:hypothetical protein